MKHIVGIAIAAIAVIALVIAVASISSAGASKKQSEQAQQSGESVEQKPGQPLYFDPEKARGKGVDDSAPYSDPRYGEETEAAGGGGYRGPAGQTEDPGEVKVIEGPVRYERVED
jgi:hypothetical protein